MRDGTNFLRQGAKPEPMRREVKNATNKFFDRFTATKDRPREFQMTVIVLVTSAVLCVIGSLIALSLTQ